MIKVPEIYIKNNLKFIKTKEKIPIEINWNNANNYTYQDIEFQKYIQNNNSYGVLCGHNNLLVIDLDDESIQNELISKYVFFKKTFIVKTATKQLFHFYFITDNPPQSFKVLGIDNKTLIDGQGVGKQVIGAGTKLSNGKYYEPINNNEILTVKYEEILNVCNSFNQKLITIEKNKEKKPFIEDESLLEIKLAFKVKDVLNLIGINTNKNPTECPFHNSVGGKCLSYTDELWHCFHCLASGDIFHLYMKYYNVDFATAKKYFIDNGKVCLKDTYENRKKITKLEKKVKLREILKEYKDLDIVNYVIYKSKDETLYKIYINNFFITLTSDEILLPKFFKKKFFAESGRMLKNISEDDWADLNNEWVEKKGMFVDHSLENIDNFILDTAINEIKEFILVEESCLALNYGRLFYRVEDESVFISTKVMDLIIKKNNFKITMTKFKCILEEYFIGKSVVIRVEKTTNRFFQLNTQKMGIDIEEFKNDNKRNN